MVHALQHPQTALLVQPSSPRYLRSTHISYTDPSSIANPRRVYFPGARPIPIGTDNRLRRDKVDNDGKVTLRWAGMMRKLYVGRKHRTKEIMLICINNDITAVNPHTGEIWGRYHLDKTKKYHRNQLGEI